jgi:hypothetical protein
MSKSSFSSRAVTPSPVLLRVVINPNEVYRLPETGQCVQVASGRAWLTAQGRDLVLEPHRPVKIAASSEAMLVSPLGEAPVILEVLN